MSSTSPGPDTPKPASPSRTNARVTRFIFGALVATLVACASWGFTSWRSSAKIEACRSNLRQIGVALQAYHEKNRCFPPAYTLGPDGERWHSWRVLLLPYLDQDDLYRQYRFDEPWNGPHNQTLRDRIPEVYACPAGSAQGVTSYLAVTGRATVWPEQYSAKLEDVRDGTSNTISIIETAGSDIAWLKPRDLTQREAMQFDQPGTKLDPSSSKHPFDGFHVLMVDGTARRIGAMVSRDRFRGLLTICGGAPLPGVDWPLDQLPDRPNIPEPRPAEDYPHTDVVAYPEVLITGGRNCVYCATFAIAWDSACQQWGGRPLRLVDDPPLARGLNAHQIRPGNLSPASYVAAAGPGNAEFRRRLEEEINAKFPGATPTLIDPDGDDHVVQLYAYLFKSLPFQVEFEDLPQPLAFRVGDARLPVASFGTAKLAQELRSEQIRSQVTILDYVNDDDFIVWLAPGVPRDSIVLAKVPPRATLQETIAAVRARIAHPNPRHTDQHFLATESLVIPKLTLSVRKEYSELAGQDIGGTLLHIAGALQTIKFRLDETGAVLESEDVIMADNGHEPTIPAGQRKFIFDRPFLIYLIERQADQPYFAAWIENTELMTPFSPNPRP